MLKVNANEIFSYHYDVIFIYINKIASNENTLENIINQWGKSILLELKGLKLPERIKSTYLDFLLWHYQVTYDPTDFLLLYFRCFRV